MSEHEDELVRALGRSLEAIPVADPDAALARVTARSRVVRRRRVAVRAGAAAAVAAVVGAVWLGARPPGSTQVDTVDSPSIATSPSTGTNGTDGTNRGTPATTDRPASTVSTAAPASAPTSAPPTSPTSPASPPSASTPGASAPASVAPSVAPPTAAPTTTPPPSSGPQTYGGLGGQVTVRVDAGNLVVVSVRPSPGYAVTEQKTQPDDVEVRFEGPAGRTRVRIRMENGLVSPEVQEEGPS